MELFDIISHQYPHIDQKNCLISIFKFSIKNYFSRLHLKSILKIFECQKTNTTTQTPVQHTTFLPYTSFTKYLYFLRYRPIYTLIPHLFCTLIQIWTFQPKVPKNSNFPNWTRRAQKIQNWSSSWPWSCCTHTFGRHCLQVLLFWLL